MVLELGKRGKIEIVTVAHALREAEENIKRKLGNAELARHHQNLLAASPVIQPIGKLSVAEMTGWEELIPRKDIPILLGAILARPQFLITLDKRDFLENEKLKRVRFPFAIVPPGEFIEHYLRRTA